MIPKSVPPHLIFALTTCLVAGLSLNLPAPAQEPRETAWPLIPLGRPAVPAVRDAAGVRNPIDAFVLARLEKAGLRPCPQADKPTLLRRVTFDLTGLAPTAAERAAFLADTSPDAYERVVDRLLASPRFGERWAQHWLDVVRYAETDGFKSNRLRPEAYRYRDYVIRAFNADLPYDRFLAQQVAGDELEPDNPEALVATGFFRLPSEDTNASNYRQMRQDLLDDVTDVFGLTFLGLTVGCARCHDHKFDPLTQKDYYRLQAFFSPLVQRDLPLAGADEKQQHARQTAKWEEATRAVRAELDAMLEPLRQQVFQELVLTFDLDTQSALRTPPAKRTPLQAQLAGFADKQLAKRYKLVYRRLSPEARKRYDGLQQQLASFDSLKPAPLSVAAGVTDGGTEAPATHRLAGGNYLRPKEVVQPAFPECLCVLPTIPPASGPHKPEAPAKGNKPEARAKESGPSLVLQACVCSSPFQRASTGRRSALASWLCRPDHPLTARVIANRVWQHHMGPGIVGTPNDFGAMGQGATHPELLDWLASELVARGWSLKALHRLIVTSATYRQASQPESNPAEAAALKADPGDKLLWHAHHRRRDAESLRDTALQVSGQLNPRMYGSSAHPELPPSLAQNYYAWDPDKQPEDRNRRSVYVLAQRNLAYPLFAAFDQPDRQTSCPERAETITAPQALAMLNGEFTLNQARYAAGRLIATHGADARALGRAAYLLILGREADTDETASAAEFLDHQARLIASGNKAGRGALPEPRSDRVPASLGAAVVDLCHALFNSAEFLYVE
jgi:hypothetical protein